VLFNLTYFRHFEVASGIKSWFEGVWSGKHVQPDHDVRSMRGMGAALEVRLRRLDVWGEAVVSSRVLICAWF
jgi:hypothetical protein